MSTQNNQNTVNPGLLSDITSEVNQENAPLLEFITTHGYKIAAVVIIFVIITALSALWKWYDSKQQRECFEQKLHIERTMQGKAKLDALKSLVESCPSKLKAIMALSLAETASAQKDYATAESAYALAAREDADGNSSLLAQINQASCLLYLGKNQEALALLESLTPRFPDSKAPVLVRQMMADCAERLGNTALAKKLYLEMAQELGGDDAEFLKRKAERVSMNANSASPK